MVARTSSTRAARRWIAAAAAIAAWSVALPAGPAHATTSSSCPTGAAKAITSAFTTLFDRIGVVTPEQRAAVLQRGDDPRVRAVLDTWLADPAGATASVTVNGVTCVRRTRAAVDTDLTLANTTLTEVLPAGHAVRAGGTWKVSVATFCTRVRLESPSYAQRGACAGNR